MAPSDQLAEGVEGVEELDGVPPLPDKVPNVSVLDLREGLSPCTFSRLQQFIDFDYSYTTTIKIYNGYLLTTKYLMTTNY
jgi:hypothetical protein